MTHVLKHAEAITRYRDHTLVDQALVSSLIEILAPRRREADIRLFRVSNHGRGLQAELTARNNGTDVEFVAPGPQEPVPPSLKRAMTLQVVTMEAVRVAPRRTRHFYWFPVISDGEALACLELSVSRPLSSIATTLVDGMIALFRNYLGLLQYSQLDTLTRLLNRKTFEDSLQKILQAPDSCAGNQPDNERRRRGPETDDWLAIFDIDYFKRINDRYGHVFGDEVLILVAELMRGVFRQQDKLFRFGGEEFVVILRHTSEKNALNVMERFRHEVENHLFPQVGQVTVSIGMTRILGYDSATTVIGRADEAMYFAKRHGRNQLRYHETLMSSGELSSQRIMNMDAEIFIGGDSDN
ncbi:MAG TPA: GGDEF domain-containing protein [Rhodocyclaceae bacterium]